jgi:hypothetical protein
MGEQHAAKNFFFAGKQPIYGALRFWGNSFLRDRWGVIGEFAIDTHGERNKSFIAVTVDQKLD